MGYNKAIIVGNLGKDPIVRTVGNNKTVCNLSVCANERFGTDDEGKPIEAKEWFRAVAWGAMAEAIGKNFCKGRPILLEGRMKTRKYETVINHDVEIEGKVYEIEVPVTKEVTELIIARFEFIDEGSRWGTTSGGTPSQGNKVKIKPKGATVTQKKVDKTDTDPYEGVDPNEVMDDEIPF